MYATDTLGATTSSFVCSANGTCQGTTQATQRAFIALQTQINRVGVNYGITKLSTDGKLGPLTLRAALNLAAALGSRLGANLDPALDELLIEIDGQSTGTRDLALNAEAITAALVRDGQKPSTWSVLETMRDIAQGIVAQGAASPELPPSSAGTPIDPYGSPTVVQPPVTPGPQSPINTWTYPPPLMTQPSAANASPPAPLPSTKTGWVVAGVIGAVAVVGGVIAAVAGRR